MVHTKSWMEIYLSAVDGFEGADFVQGGKNVESKCSLNLIEKSDCGHRRMQYLIHFLPGEWLKQR